MRRGAALAVAAATLVVGAAAAPAQPSAPGWNGPYVGIDAGAKLGSADWTATALYNGGSSGGFPPLPPDASSPRRYDLNAARVGGYVGYNWQRGQWVVGPELGFGWSDAQQTQAYLPGCGLGCGGFFPPPGPNDTASVALHWDANITGRAGYLLGPGLLLYGKGGLALQQLDATGACVNPSTDSQYCFGPGTQNPIKHGMTLVGLTVGGGVETRLGDNWLLRGEYRFSYFPAVGDTLAFPPSATGDDNTYRYRLSAQTHTFTVGLAYKF